MAATSIPCVCGGEATYRVGDVSHQIGERTILVKNVPHFHCAVCGTSKYDIQTKVSPLLKDAFHNGWSEIEWRA